MKNSAPNVQRNQDEKLGITYLSSSLFSHITHPHVSQSQEQPKIM